MLKQVGKTVLSALDGEFILRWIPNGGGVVVARSIWIGCVAFLCYIAVLERLAVGSSWHFSSEHLRAQVVANLSVGGAILAGAYAALYARFSSQWLYLAGLYNQIMAVQVQPSSATDEVHERMLAFWKAGFIEDAEAVHLATKPMYAAVIASMLRNERVRKAYVASTVAGEAGLKKLESRITEVLGVETVNKIKLLDADQLHIETAIGE